MHFNSVLSESVAVIVAVPFFFALTTPVEDTVATALLLVDHFTLSDVLLTESLWLNPAVNVILVLLICASSEVF